MNKYDEMSSFDIAVELKKYVKGSFSVYADHKTPFVLCEDTNEEFDPCNNPADMWPIILDNGICLTSPVLGRKTKYWSATWNADGGSWAIPDFACGDDNPLRAAAIVFLMMKDAE